MTILSQNQINIQAAKELFTQALAVSMTNYRVGNAITFRNSPRHQMYTLLLERRQTTSIESFATIRGMRDATEWIANNSPIREFFNLLATNFILLWHETDSKYDSFCRQIAMALTAASPSGSEGISQIAPLPEEVIERVLPFTDILEQIKSTKHLFAYTLYLLWADIDELSRKDETYNAIEPTRTIAKPARQQAT